MIRKAFLMQVHPARQDEYIRRHNPIWADLEAALKSHGAHSYSIFLDQRQSQLFAYVEIESLERWNQIAETEVCRRWWKFMREIMPSNNDDSPVSLELKEAFHLP
jgi:L-rhamnose mutarotase